MNETRLIQIYREDEKGKTTAAIGTVVRATGRRYWVSMARLLKTDDLGEVTGLSHVLGVAVLPCGRNFGFSWNMTQVQQKTAALYYDHYLLGARNIALGADGGEPHGMLMLNEAIGVCSLGFVDETSLVKAFKEEPAALKIILTEYCPSETLRDQTGYITEMAMRRHPYERGVRVREGIEYQKMSIKEYVLAF